ncbi:hypothetical protein DLJ53_25365 [Acuticoccus sediminis]|uniref:Sulfotransferase family protein n=1 Tax=Acuticoccus sediminis TaxID=2184697 RepID=A0A8B2NHK0_9HYPH|nr:hypothetical protein [Acuticoccus sediminis]RAH98961.1 hypothetical protein DLJ53_25365 [Acuticoccus sediminis]
MDVLTLHIGHMKTGTTSLQATFRDNAATLAAHGLYYYGKTRTNHALVRPFSKRTKARNESKFLKEYRNEAKANRLPQGLISSETLLRLAPDEIEACLASMRDIAGRVQVLIYVREPVALAISAAHQGVRSGRPLAEIEAQPRILNLTQIITRWRSAVGKENMIVRPFDRAQLANGDVIDDALSVLGCASAGPALQRQAVNEGLSVLGIHMLDRAMARMPDRKMPYDQQRAFNFIKGPRYVLPEAALDRVRKRSAPHVAFLREEFGIELPPSTERPSAPLALSEAELASLAEVFHEINAFAYRLDRSALGRVLGTRMPYSNRFKDEDHPLRAKLAKLGVLDELAAQVATDEDDAEAE